SAEQSSHSGEVQITSNASLMARVYGDGTWQLRTERLSPVNPLEVVTCGSDLPSARSRSMRSRRIYDAPLSFLFLVFWSCATGCKGHSDCDAIAVGTPLANLPHVWGPPNQSTYYGCNQVSPTTEEVALLHCCSDGFNQPVNGGLRRCASGLV